MSHARPSTSHAPIAVIGMGCRFPGGANNPEAFWDSLVAGRDGTMLIPADRYDRERYYDPEGKGHMPITQRAGILDGVDLTGFDTGFFRMSPREAIDLDPQQRLLLEVTAETFQDAGIPLDQTEGGHTGVYVGISSNDYSGGHYFSGDLSKLSTYSMLGTMMNTASGRIAYVFGLHGPTLSVDTACSASLTSLHLAVQALRAGECETALAGGVNILLSPVPFAYLSLIGALSAEGRCRSYDAAASGYARAEGCGMVLLKPLDAALADGDRIHGIIHGTAINHDGASPGLTVPSPSAQQAVMQHALTDAGLRGADVAYVEAHGTGTPTGDPIEMKSLGHVYGQDRDPADPLWVGSVKSNFGHLESAAGIASVIKVILSLKHRQLPPNLHFHTPSPHIPWDSLPVSIPVQNEALATNGAPLYAAASCFGISGTNGHVILGQAPPACDTSGVAARSGQERQTARVRPSAEGQTNWLLLSAKTADALRILVRDTVSFLRSGPAQSFAKMARSSALHRAHFKHRLAVSGQAAEPVADALDAWLHGAVSPTVWAPASADHPMPLNPDPLMERVQAYLRGEIVNWAAIFPSSPPVSLPFHPFIRQRHWTDPNAHLDRTHAPDSGGEDADFFLGSMLVQPGNTTVYRRLVRQGSDAMLEEHRVAGLRVMPAAWFLTQAEQLARRLLGTEAIELQDIQFGGTVILSERESRMLYVRAQPEGDAFRIAVWSRMETGQQAGESPWLRHLDAKALVAPPAAVSLAQSQGLSPRMLKHQLPEHLDKAAFYNSTSAAGFDYRGSHRAVQAMHRGPEEALVRVRVISLLAPHRPVAMLDACFQACLAVYLNRENEPERVYVTLAVKRYFPFRPLGEDAWAWFRLRRQEGDVLEGDLHIVDAAGDLVALLNGCVAQRIPVQRMLAANQAGAVGDETEALGMDLEQFYAGIEPANSAEWETIVSERVAETVARVLGMGKHNQIDPVQPLREVGFDSLVNARFVAALSQGSGIELPKTLYLEYPSVQAVAAYLTGLTAFQDRVTAQALAHRHLVSV